MAPVEPLLEHPPIELQPGELAIVKARRTHQRRRGCRRFEHWLAFLQSRLWCAHGTRTGWQRICDNYATELAQIAGSLQQQDEGLVAVGSGLVLARAWGQARPGLAGLAPDR